MPTCDIGPDWPARNAFETASMCDCVAADIPMSLAAVLAMGAIGELAPFANGWPSSVRVRGVNPEQLSHCGRVEGPGDWREIRYNLRGKCCFRTDHSPPSRVEDRSSQAAFEVHQFADLLLADVFKRTKLSREDEIGNKRQEFRLLKYAVINSLANAIVPWLARMIVLQSLT